MMVVDRWDRRRMREPENYDTKFTRVTTEGGGGGG